MNINVAFTDVREYRRNVLDGKPDPRQLSSEEVLEEVSEEVLQEVSEEAAAKSRTTSMMSCVKATGYNSCP